MAVMIDQSGPNPVVVSMTKGGDASLRMALKTQNITLADIPDSGGRYAVPRIDQNGFPVINLGSSQYGALTVSSLIATNLSAVSAYTGSLTVNGALTVGTSGNIHSGQTAWDTGIGWWFEYNAGSPRASMGNHAGSHWTWDATSFKIYNASATLIFDSSGLNGSGVNFNASNVDYVSGATIDSLKPAEVNAAAALKGLQNTIPQPAPDSSGVVTGWWSPASAVASNMYATNANAPVMGYFEAAVAGGSIDVWASRGDVPIQFLATGGDTLYAEAYIDMQTGVSVELFCYVQHADGTHSSYAFFTGSLVGTWSPQLGTVTLPADAVNYQIGFYISGTNGNNGYFTNVVVGHQSRALTTAGSSVQLGDARNIRGVTASGVAQGFYWSVTNMITATSTSITVAAATLIMGGSGTGNVSYNGSSISGLSPSTTYYLYYIDPGYTGGTQTLHASTTKTDLAGNPNIIYIGYWTTPASGSGGGGGGGGCLHESTSVRVLREGREYGIVARDMVAGDQVWTDSGWQPVLQVDLELHEDWIHIGADCIGESVPTLYVVLTPTQPLYKEDGGMVRARELTLGVRLKADGRIAEVVHLSLQKRQPANKVIVRIPEPHLFYLEAGGLFVHNGNPKP